MARILFLHGLDAKPGGIKPTFLQQQGHTVLNPHLPREDFDESVRIAQAELDDKMPEVVVGSSRGGAVALALNAGATPVVVLAPAWRFFDLKPRIPPILRILHSPADALIPIEHSRELLGLADGNDVTLEEIGESHGMTDPFALSALDRLVRELAATTN